MDLPWAQNVNGLDETTGYVLEGVGIVVERQREL